MYCRQCSSATDSTTVAERQQSSANAAAQPTSSKPFIQFNYLRIDHPSNTSINVDGAHGVHTDHRPNTNLHRASTISCGTTVSDSSSAEPTAKSPSFHCSSDDLRRSRSIHFSVMMGSYHHRRCKKEHASKKIGQSLLSKLSAISKLRVRSSPASDAEQQGGNVYRWLRRAASTRSVTTDLATEFDLNNEEERPSQIASTPLCEMDGGFHFRNPAELPAYHGHAALSQTGLDVDFLPELPSPNPVVLLELPEVHSVRPNEMTTQVVQTCHPPAPIPQASIVSALSSSQWGSSMSEYQSSWQISGCSAVSEFTPTTSTSEVDRGQDEFAPAIGQDDVPSSPQPPSLNTHLTIPQTSIIDGPLTDSPTSGDLSEFLVHQQKEGLEHTTIRGSNSQEFGYGEVKTLPSCLGQTQPLLEPQELKLSSPHFSELLQAPHTPSSPNCDSLPAYGAWHAKPYTDHSSRFLEACRRYAGSISRIGHTNLKKALEHAFNTTVLFYLGISDDADRAVAMTLRQAWDVQPTIDGALIGIYRLLTYEATPTPYQLTSLTLLSLSLLGLSLGTQDLADAVRILHSHARSWSNLVACEQERKSFENLIDELWLLAEQDHYHMHLREVAREHSFHPESESLLLMDSDNFIVQVAQIFIHLTAGADMQACTDSPPSFKEVMEENYRSMLVTLPDHIHPSASFPLAYCSGVNQKLDLPDTYEALESFIHAEHSEDIAVEGPQTLEHVKSLLKVLSGKYIGRVALWLYHQFRITARRVVSHPQGLTPPSSETWLSINPQDHREAILSDMSSNSSRGPRQSKGQPAELPRKLQVKVSPKPYQAVKRKSSSDSNEGEVFECVQHKKVFTGKYAESNFKRHMRRTKEHGFAGFKCHICGTEMPRVDHFKAHMRKWHQLNVHGRSGDYSFESMNGVRGVAELEGDAGVAADGFVDMPAFFGE